MNALVSFPSRYVLVICLASAAFLAGCNRSATTSSVAVTNTAEASTEPLIAEANAKSNTGRQKGKITLEAVEQMFENMRSNASLDVEGELLWGYFFTDPDPKKLERAVPALTGSGYRFVDLYPTDDGHTYFLHVEKVERHTPQSLHLRDQEFYRLAEQYDLESYDGMDVGPAAK